ncbi:MAG: isoprenylcysteine carboxylmethyltransferase family protein [Rhodospirillales bacterium]|nr:isoprenylcysteine carboxylmethyltransferase family protein [Alphaproteobacteria bacterium]USO03110.1 MAG: isoprenylcysteine carboxylmethyltransferase family protein [Rhodospirillales bacterium]
MARSLNKSRMRNSRIVLALVLCAAFFTKALVGYETPFHDMLDFAGYVLVAFCALGRLYSTAFLGGFKNEKLITYGAFSICRNPLYFFSLLGMTGVALISAHLAIIIVMPLTFLVLYHFLILREEAFLKETFGQAYLDYMDSTPRLFPNFRLYKAPHKVEVAPKYLKKAFLDAIWWFAAYPLFEFAEFLQESGLIRPVLMLP